MTKKGETNNNRRQHDNPARTGAIFALAVALTEAGQQSGGPALTRDGLEAVACGGADEGRAEDEVLDGMVRARRLLPSSPCHSVLYAHAVAHACGGGGGERLID